MPMAASTLAATGAVSSGSRMPASSRASRRAAAAPASRGLAGSAPAAVKSARMSLVAQARSQRRSAGRRPAWRASMRDSSSWRAAWHQFARSLRGEADLGVGGVGALVDQGAPGDRVALAVGGDGGVAVVGVGLQQVAVDLDDRDVAQVAGGAAQARPGGAGDRDRAAGDRRGPRRSWRRRGFSSRRRGRRARRGRGRRGLWRWRTWRAVLSGSRGGG